MKKATAMKTPAAYKAERKKNKKIKPRWGDAKAIAIKNNQQGKL